MSNATVSWVISISSTGFVLGSCASRIISDKYGRRITILGSALPIVLGAITMIFAREAWMLAAGRFLCGCGPGLFTSVSPVYIAEIADKDIRGRLALSARFMFSFGCLLAMTVGAFVSFQTLNSMLLVLPVIYFLACWWIPESPYYLLKAGKIEAARKTMHMLTGIRDENVIEERISQIQSHLQIEMRRSSSLKEFVTGSRYRKAIFIVAGLKIPQILTGIHAIQYYLGPILRESKADINISTGVIIFGLVRFLLGIMSSMLVDKLGRRPLLTSSFFGTGTLLAVIAIYFKIQTKYAVSYPYTLTPFVAIILATIVSVIGYESIVYLIPSELFPMNVKSLAISLVVMLGGLCNFTSLKTYQPIKDWIGLSGLFSIYAGAAFIGAGFGYFFVPETKNKTLEEIQTQLNGNIYDEEENLRKFAVINRDDLAVNGNVESRESEKTPLN